MVYGGFSGGWVRAVPPKVHKAQSAGTFLGTLRSRDISGQTGTRTIRQQDATFMGIVAWLALAHCVALTRQESPEMKKQCRSSPVEMTFCFLWASGIDFDLMQNICPLILRGLCLQPLGLQNID